MKPKSRLWIHQVQSFFVRCLISLLEAGSLKSYGVLVEDLTKQTRMSFAMTGLILPLQHSLCYFLAPLATTLSNRIGLRATVMLGGLLAGLGYIGNGIFPLNPIFLAIFCTCAGVGYSIAQLPSYLHLRNAFPDEASFGIVQTLSDQFGYVGISILPLVFEKFVEMYDLQGALLLFGGLNLHIVIAGVMIKPSVPSSVKDDRVNTGTESDTSSDDEINAPLEKQSDCVTLEQNKSIKQVTSHKETSNNTPRYQPVINSSDDGHGLNSAYFFLKRNKAVMFLTSCVLSTSFTYFGWILFLIPLGKEKGLVPSQAVLLSTVAGVGALFGRVWCIILFWKNVKRPFCYFGLPALLQCFTFLCLSLFANNFSELMVISFISGVPFGVLGAAVGGVCAIKVSSSDFQAAFVVVCVFIAFGTEVGGGVCGAVYDCTGSSETVFLVLATSNMFLVSVSVVWTLWERRNEAL